MRKTVLAAGAAALLSSQAVYASPAKTAPAVDPLVALSMLGTSQSRAAVCGGIAACGVPLAAGTSAAAPSPAVATAASTAAVQGPGLPRESKGLHMILLIGGGMILIAVLAALLLGDDDEEPISPA